MSDRLTFSDAKSRPGRTDLAVPAALLLVAVFSQIRLPYFPEPGLFTSKPDDWTFSIASHAVAVLFALQCGAVLRGMLPAKTPGSHRALTAVAGILMASIPISLIPVDLLVAWTLALAGWNFHLNLSVSGFVPALFSGLCTGTALTLSHTTLGAAIALLFLQLISLRSSKGASPLRNPLFWLSGLLIGLLPFVLNTVQSPSLGVDQADWQAGLHSLIKSITGMGWMFLPFLILGTGVALFQARTTLLGLLLPALLGIILLGGVTGLSGVQGLATLPVSILCGYGMFRVLRGVEQGMRNAGSPKAGAVVPTALLLGLAGYAGWLVTLFF
jgi:hypothetical protein